ncbi:MAG TPA: peptidase C69, partial [Tissierella sp.]
SVAKGLSVFSDRIGEKIASDVVTLVDDGSIVNSWGSLGVDDEGMRTQKNILIENGILKGYMIDKLNARRMNMNPTASGRRQSYRFAPTARMTNTYIDKGTSTKEEIIGNTEKGLFAKYISAGSVNPATGDFNFSLSEAYLIKNGKITKPVKGATLIGNGNKILQDVDMVGNNLEIGQGYCYAGSGALFIGAGQPTLRVKTMTVGGREE